jgi:endosialidase-like protein
MAAAASPLSVIPAGLSALTGLLGALFGGSQTTTGVSGTTGGTETNSSGSSNSTNTLQQLMQFLTQMTGSTTGTQTGTGTTTTTPNLNPASQSLISQLSGAMSGLTAPSLGGYVANQTANINNNANAQSAAVNNIMASRGLSTSPVAATAQVGVGQNRINQINQVQAQAPIEQNQLNLQNLGAVSQFASLLPGLSGATTGQTTGQTTGTTSAQTTSGTQNTQSTQQMWQNLFNYLNSATSSNTNSTSTTSSPGLLSDVRLKKDIKPIEAAIDKISKLNAATWKWKGGGGSQGFIAQEVEKVLPELVGETDEFKVGIPLKTVNYVGMIPYMIDAIKVLNLRTVERSA